MKTRDGYEIKTGLWLSSTDGIVEVVNVYADEFEVTEVIFDEDDTDKFEYGDVYTLTKGDAHKYTYQ